jgi:hypothetical protein
MAALMSSALPIHPDFFSHSSPQQTLQAGILPSDQLEIDEISQDLNDSFLSSQCPDKWQQ